jgi:dolichol-phosphate mannosyltransferase
MNVLQIIVVLPAYNEARNLKILLPGLIALKEGRDLPLFAILVDDGSQDETGVFAEAIAQYYSWFKVVHHTQNQGLGSALATGFIEALSIAKQDDVIITMDADNTMDIFTIPELARTLENGADLAVASRYMPGASVKGVPTFRRLASWGGSVFCRLALRVPGLKDYTSGYRAYRAAALRAAMEQWGTDFITARAFDCQMEILLKTLPYIRKVKEVPIKLDYSPKKGKSHLRFWQTVKGYLYQFRWFFRHSETLRKKWPATLPSDATKGGW